jgi:hypothetical protein
MDAKIAEHKAAAIRRFIVPFPSAKGRVMVAAREPARKTGRSEVRPDRNRDVEELAGDS